MKSFIRRDRRRGPEGEELPPRPLTRVEKLRAQVFLGETFKIKSDLLFVPPRISIGIFFSKFATFGLRNISIQFVLWHFFHFSVCGLTSLSYRKHQYCNTLFIRVYNEAVLSRVLPRWDKELLTNFYYSWTTKHKHGCSFGLGVLIGKLLSQFNVLVQKEN